LERIKGQEHFDQLVKEKETAESKLKKAKSAQAKLEIQAGEDKNELKENEKNITDLAAQIIEKEEEIDGFTTEINNLQDQVEELKT
jgi:chromosome segregation ATPase